MKKWREKGLRFRVFVFLLFSFLCPNLGLFLCPLFIFSGLDTLLFFILSYFSFFLFLGFLLPFGPISLPQLFFVLFFLFFWFVGLSLFPFLGRIFLFFLFFLFLDLDFPQALFFFFLGHIFTHSPWVYSVGQILPLPTLFLRLGLGFIKEAIWTCVWIRNVWVFF